MLRFGACSTARPLACGSATGTSSDPSVDSYKTRFLSPDAVDLSVHRSNPVWLWGPRLVAIPRRPPSPENVIGRVLQYDLSPSGARRALVEYDHDSTTRALCNRVWDRVERGLLRAQQRRRRAAQGGQGRRRDHGIPALVAAGRLQRHPPRQQPRPHPERDAASAAPRRPGEAAQTDPAARLRASRRQCGTAARWRPGRPGAGEVASAQLTSAGAGASPAWTMPALRGPRAVGAVARRPRAAQAGTAFGPSAARTSAPSRRR